MTGMNKHQILSISLLLLSQIAYADEVLKIAPVDVSGVRDTLSDRRDSNTQKVMVGRQEIENMSVMTVGEVLNKLPGVEIKDGGQRARGMSRDSIQIMIDGEKQSRSAMGVLSRLPASEINRVEIHRGASAEFGGGSPLTINIVLNKALAKNSSEYKAGFGFKSDEPNAQLSWTENGGTNDFSWSLPVSLNFSRSPVKSNTSKQGPNVVSGLSGVGIQDEFLSGTSEMGHHAFSPKFTWKSGRDSFTLAPMLFMGPSERDVRTDLSEYAAGQWLPNGYRLSQDDGYSHMLRLRMSGEKFFGESKLSSRLSLNHRLNVSDVNQFAVDAANNRTLSNQRARSEDDEVNASLRWDQPVDSHYLSMATEISDFKRKDTQKFTGSFVNREDYESKTQEQVVWVQDAWTPKDAVTLTSGLRFEHATLKSDQQQQSETALLPSLAVRWQPNDAWVLRSSLGAGMKMPKINEISNTTSRSFVINTPLDADQRGNPNLKPERSINFEAVAERYLANKKGVMAANLYVRSTQDFIERRVQEESGRWVDRPYNEGDAVHWGLELDGKIATDDWAWQGGTLKSHLTLPKARVDDTRLGITRMARDTPKYVLSLGLDQSLPQWKSNFGWSLQLSGRSVTDIPNENTSFTEARALLDAFWLYQMHPKFNLRVSAQNILGEDIVRRSRYLQASDAWQYDNQEFAYRSVMFFIEGKL